jgi:hypothetical protein
MADRKKKEEEGEGFLCVWVVTLAASFRSSLPFPLTVNYDIYFHV